MKNMDSTLQKGSICLTQFPFSDMQLAKIRPVVVLHHDKVYDDVLIAAISSLTTRLPSQNTILILDSDKYFSGTGLKKESIILMSRIVSLDRKRLFYQLGHLHQHYLEELDRKMLNLLKLGIITPTNETNLTNKTKYIPYGKQTIDDDDIYAVVKTLRSDWLTTGPKLDEFERAVAEFVGAKHGLAFSNGTAALHAAMFALGIGPGDEVIVPPITFVATANAVAFCGGKPVFVDVERDTLLIDPAKIETRITSRTKAILAVDYTGQPCDYDRLRAIARKHKIKLVADGCHALGAEYKGKKVGNMADLTVFSFHPVKHITTGEGGMVTTNDTDLVARMRMFRNHGITTDFRQREEKGAWFYEMTELGFNYRITDIQCALGITQFKKHPAWLKKRRALAAKYDKAFSGLDEIIPLTVRDGVKHAYHLYVVKLNGSKSRQEIFTEYRRRGIGVNVHYIPVHLQPFYEKTFGSAEGDCPVAEEEYSKILSLPIFQGMTGSEVNKVIRITKEILSC